MSFAFWNILGTILSLGTSSILHCAKFGQRFLVWPEELPKCFRSLWYLLPCSNDYTPRKRSLGVYRNHPICSSVQSKLNLGYNFWTKRDSAFILHMCITCVKTFLLVPKILTSRPWPWLLKKNSTLAITFEQREMGLSYYTCVFFVERPFCWYQKFWPCNLDL